jgi:hypothetical protein
LYLSRLSSGLMAEEGTQDITRKGVRREGSRREQLQSQRTSWTIYRDRAAACSDAIVGVKGGDNCEHLFRSRIHLEVTSQVLHFDPNFIPFVYA